MCLVYRSWRSGTSQEHSKPTQHRLPRPLGLKDISGQYRRSECPVRVPFYGPVDDRAARLPMANSGKACTLCRFLNLTPPSFEFHLFYDDANRFGGQSEFSPYRGKGEAVASAGIYF